MNLFEGRLRDGGRRFEGAEFNYRWQVKRHPEARDGQEVSIGIRPSDIKISRDDLNGQCVSGPVEFQEPLGSDLFLTLRVGERFLIVRTDPDFEVGPGESIQASFPESRVHLFDRASGARLASLEG